MLMVANLNYSIEHMTASVAFLFPTFVMRREEYRLDEIPGYLEVRAPLVDRAAAVVAITPATFAFPDRDKPVAGLPDTLQAHYASYIESVAIGAWLEPRVGKCDLVAGYSMGLFAALCHTGAMAFEDGLTLMRGLCVAVQDSVDPGAYAIGAIDGLPPDAVAGVAATWPGIEVVDIYGQGTTIVTGREGDVAAVLDTCQQRGATYTRLTPATAPYHSTALKAVRPIIEELADLTAIRSPRCRVVSALTQRLLSSPEDVRLEIASNVSTAMNWYATMREVRQLGMTALCECGSSNSLANMARRDLPGDYIIQDVRGLDR